MNKTKNSPLHTILKIKKFSNLTYKNPIYINQFENKDIKNLPKRDRYYGVFMEITGYFEKSKFYREIFLPRMDERKAFMRMNRKFTQLTQEEFEEQKKKLQINNTYDEYSSRQDIPLFTYITNDPDQFENWSAIRIFEWWRNLRMSGIEKQNWDVFDAVKYLFINQFMRIMNSYLKYGVDNRDKLAFIELQEYLQLVDEFYNKRQYQYLLDAHLAFCEWFSARFIGGLLFESGRNNVQKYVSSSIYNNRKDSGSIFTIEQSVIIIKEFFNKTLEDNNIILVIPQSFFQKESKFINIYTAPLIVFLGINYRTHTNSNRFQDNYSPFNQIIHDLVHSKSCKSSYEYLYSRTNNYDDIKLFEQRCKFLTIVSSIDNDNCKKLLWLILHEISFFENDITEIVIGTTIESITFFDFNILFERLNDVKIQSLLKKYLTFEPENSEILDAIYTLICACIVFFMSNFLPLEYFKDLKITVESIVFMNNESNISNKVIKISRKEKLLIEFEYDVKTKQLKLRSLSDYNLLKGILELQSKGVLLFPNQYCFESYLLSPNTIQACEILSQSAFFNNIFLPKMRERVAKNREIMRVNTKFSKLSESNFRTKQSELGIKTNSFNKYQERYDTRLFKYIYEDKDQFENWSAIRIFEWWRNLRMSGTQFSTFREKILKENWNVFDAVKYLFINQILHILNSYIKYGISDSDESSNLDFTELQKYLSHVDKFYTSGGQYQYLLDAHLGYCQWFNVRFIRGLLFETGIKNTYSNTSTYILSKNDSLIESIRKLFNYTLEDTNSILFAPSSYFQKESKFINTYSAPLIVFLGVNYRTHIDSPNFKSLYSPERQLYHDITVHYSNMLIKSNYNNIKIKENNDVTLFAKRCKFLMIISLINDYNVSILLWYILHERSKSYFIYSSNFFNIEILFNKLLNNDDMLDKIDRDTIDNSLKRILINGINKLRYVCIIFFICQYLLLNEIKQIKIDIIPDKFNDNIKIFFNEEIIIEFQINIDNKQINITNIIPNIDRRYIEGLNYINKNFNISILNPIQSKINNYEKTKKSIKNILNTVKSIQYLKQLQQAQQK